jgi:hypothetical protein
LSYSFKLGKWRIWIKSFCFKQWALSYGIHGAV